MNIFELTFLTVPLAGAFFGGREGAKHHTIGMVIGISVGFAIGAALYFGAIMLSAAIMKTTGIEKPNKTGIWCTLAQWIVIFLFILSPIVAAILSQTAVGMIFKWK